jgi:hypothetical protein
MASRSAGCRCLDGDVLVLVVRVMYARLLAFTELASSWLIRPAVVTGEGSRRAPSPVLR